MRNAGVIFVLLLSLFQGLNAETWYVSVVNGLGSNSGTKESPWKSISAASKRANSGDTILVAPGLYKEEVKITKKFPSDKPPLTIKAEDPDNKPLIDCQGKRQNGIHISGDAKSGNSERHIIIDGFKILNASVAGIWIGYCDFVTVRNTICGDNGVWGIFTANTRHITIENCELYGSKREHGLYFSNSNSYCVARNNLIHNNAGSGIHNNGDKSIIARPGDMGINNYCLIENNKIYECGIPRGGGGINMDSCLDYVVRNNLIYNCYASGITTYRGDGTRSGRCRIYNNTVYFRPGEGRACVLVNGSPDCMIMNNILVGGVEQKSPIFFERSNDIENAKVFANLLFLSTGKIGQVRNRVDYYSLGGEELKSFQFKDNITADPLFVDISKGDFHLKPNSPAIGKALWVETLGTSLDKVKREQGKAIDLGCY